MQTLVTTLQSHAERYPHRPLVTLVQRESRQTLSFGSVWSGCQRFARLLEQSGVPVGAVVIIMLKHGAGLYEAFTGAMAYGAIPSFMPYPTPKQKPELFWSAHKQLFARIAPGAIVVYDAIEADIRHIAPPGAVIINERDMAAGAPPHTSHMGSSPDQIAFLQHSSGTTGLKKGVMLTHVAVLNQLASYAPSIEFTADSVITSWLPLYHDMGLLTCFMLPLVKGAHVIHLDPFDWVGAPLVLLDEIESNAATHCWIPNFAFNHLTATRRRAMRRHWDLSTLKALINCSEPCKSESMDGFASAFADCGVLPQTPQVCYAMAETVFAITQTPLGEKVRSLAVSRAGLGEMKARDPLDQSDLQNIVSCGAPIAGMRVQIRGEDGAVMPDGAVGEICATGTSLYSGYFRLPDITAQRLRDGWHYTGDLGFMLGGLLYLTGRKDDLVIVRGRNYYAHDLEAIISETTGVKPGRVVVFAVDSIELGTTEVICMVELLDPAEHLEARRAIKANVESLSGLMLSAVQVVPPGALHKTTSGKISREANRKAFLASRHSKDAAHA